MAARQAVVTLLGVVLVATAARGDWELQPPLLQANLQALNDNALCQGRATSCSADCGSLVQCAFVTDVWQVIATSRCPNRTPYCTLNGATASCTATPPATGATCNPAPPDPLPANAFNCSASGYFPDVSSCTRYYLCVGDDAYRMDCSRFPGTVYDQRTTRCVPRSRGTCYTLRCTRPTGNQPVQYHVYTPAPWIYAVCTSNDAARALVGTCPNQRQSMGPDGECVESCSAEGRFRPLDAADTDATSYVDCVDLGNGRFSAPTPGTCPTNSTFDATLGQCVDTP